MLRKIFGDGGDDPAPGPRRGAIKLTPRAFDAVFGGGVPPTSRKKRH
jgi:hypothetical protein